MPEKLRVVVDTNTLVSALIARGNEFEFLNEAEHGKFKLILSFQILEELRDVLSRPKFGYSAEHIEEFIAYLIEIGEIVMPAIKLDIIKEDPNDNMVLECAETGKVDYIVSGDDHLLKLKSHKNIKIVKTSSILDIIKK